MSCNLFLIVDRSIGVFMIFLYVGNCFVLTGNRKGQASSWHSRSSRMDLQGASSLISFLETFSFFGVWVEGDIVLQMLELEISLWLQLVVVDWSSFVAMELWDGAGLKWRITLFYSLKHARTDYFKTEKFKNSSLK